LLPYPLPPEKYIAAKFVGILSIAKNSMMFIQEPMLPVPSASGRLPNYKNSFILRCTSNRLQKKQKIAARGNALANNTIKPNCFICSR
jgi:hypothetical protein